MSSQNRFYKMLSERNSDYLHLKLKSTDGLKSNRYGEIVDYGCSMCKLNDTENILHFFGLCPILITFRRQVFKKADYQKRKLWLF